MHQKRPVREWLTLSAYGSSCWNIYLLWNSLSYSHWIQSFTISLSAGYSWSLSNSKTFNTTSARLMMNNTVIIYYKSWCQLTRSIWSNKISAVKVGNPSKFTSTIYSKSKIMAQTTSVGFYSMMDKELSLRSSKRLLSKVPTLVIAFQWLTTLLGSSS